MEKSEQQQTEQITNTKKHNQKRNMKNKRKQLKRLNKTLKTSNLKIK